MPTHPVKFIRADCTLTVHHSFCHGLAASRSTNVAFIISVSGPGCTPEGQSAWVIENHMRAKRFSDSDVQSALSLFRMHSRCVATDSGWEEYRIAAEAAKSKPWDSSELAYPSPDQQQLWRLIWNYDPVPALKKVHCPVLAIWGEMDLLVPPQESVNIWKAALAWAGNRDVTLKTFPDADHNLSDVRTGFQSPEYFSGQRDWILKRVQINP